LFVELLLLQPIAHSAMRLLNIKTDFIDVSSLRVGVKGVSRNRVPSDLAALHTLLPIPFTFSRNCDRGGLSWYFTPRIDSI